MTAFANILAGIVTKLAAAPAVSATIDRARLRPIPEATADAVVVRIESSTPDRFAILGGPTDWDTVIAIECYARSTGLTADQAIDALLGKVYARLAADTSLGGLVGDLTPTDLNYDFAAGADHMACATLTLKVLHRTTNQSLE
ncbi:MAG: hypothetical protein JWQ72_3833 [Polaromonas sp.]|nr:hypothetical protein [Polaromonas sp.]